MSNNAKVESNFPLGVGGAGASPMRHIENLHIPLWLLKDTCWLLQWKELGVTMIVPTLGVAIAIAVKTFREDVFWINLAICFWITANAFWMCMEFFAHEEFKFYAGIPFAFGFACVGWFYLRRFLAKRSSKLEDYL